jgi:hypothetical protein
MTAGSEHDPFVQLIEDYLVFGEEYHFGTTARSSEIREAAQAIAAERDTLRTENERLYQESFEWQAALWNTQTDRDKWRAVAEAATECPTCGKPYRKAWEEGGLCEDEWHDEHPTREEYNALCARNKELFEGMVVLSAGKEQPCSSE